MLQVFENFLCYECFHIFQIKMTLLEEQCDLLFLYISVIKNFSGV